MGNENIKASLHELKEHFGAERNSALDLDKLVRQPVDREIVTDFWALSSAEIDREMWNRLPLLDADADCLPDGPIRSNRPLLGNVIVLAKKILRRLLAPYSSMLLQKQNRLNRELVTFQLLAFLKLGQLDKKIKALEEKLADLPDGIRVEAERRDADSGK